MSVAVYAPWECSTDLVTVMIILFLKYYSVRKTQDVVEKKKEPPVAEVTEKRRVQDAAPVVDAKVTPDVLIGESLG